MESEFNLESLLKAYDFNLTYAKTLVDDISPEFMYRSFGDGLENYPAFTLGHLTIASALIAEELGESYRVPDGWDRFFGRKGPGDPRRPLQYEPGMPAKESLIEELSEKHKIVTTLLGNTAPDRFFEKVEWRFDRYFPRLVDCITFMCITHEAMHLGQLSAWRRAAGMPSALAQL